MNPNKFNFGKNDAYGDSWSEISTKEEELKKQLENLQAQKEDIRAYEAFQDAAAFDNLENIKRTNPEFGIDALEQYAETIQGLKELLNEIPVMHESRAGTPEANKYESRRQELQRTIALKERILGKKLAKNNQEFGSRAEIVSDYFNNMFGKDLTADIELPEPESNKTFGPEPAPEQLIGLNGEELEKEVSLQKETPEEKIRRLGEALGWSDEEINKRIDAFNNSGEANHDEDKKVDNPPTSLEEQFDEAVRNGASAQELAKISHKFYKEGQFLNGGKLELSEEYRDRYEKMRRVISAQREAEKPAVADSDKKLETEKPLTRREKLKKWGKRILYSAGVLLAVWGGKTVADNMQNNNSTEPTIDHVDKNQDKDQVANAKDEFNKFVADGETGAENLTNNGHYDKQNDTYWSQMNLKRNGEDIGNISTFGDKTPEQIMEMHRNGSLEDNLSYQAQFMFMDGLAEKYFGISANEAQDLYSRAQNGDQEAFKKINDGFEKMTAEVDRFEWAGNVPANFSSFFGDMDENGHITMSTAHGLNFEDKMLNMVLKDGTVVSIDGTCTQIIIKGAVVELPQIKGFTPPADVVIPPAITNPPTPTPAPPTTTTPTPPTTTTPTPPTTTTPTPPTTQEPPTTEAPKNRSKEDPGTYNGVTPAEAGEETPAVSTEEQNNSVNPNALPGDNVSGVMAPGAEPAPAQTEEVVVQYSGEWTVDPAVQQQQIQQQQAQEQANQNADQSAKVEEVQVGDQSVSLDEIRQAQQQTTTNGN